MARGRLFSRKTKKTARGRGGETRPEIESRRTSIGSLPTLRIIARFPVRIPVSSSADRIHFVFFITDPHGYIHIPMYTGRSLWFNWFSLGVVLFFSCRGIYRKLLDRNRMRLQQRIFSDNISSEPLDRGYVITNYLLNARYGITVLPMQHRSRNYGRRCRYRLLSYGKKKQLTTHISALLLYQLYTWLALLITRL